MTENYGKGFSERNLEQMRKFYLTYSISQTVSAKFKLSYSHYLTLMRVENIEERNFYEIEAINNSWSLRELKRQMDSALYERLVLSRDKEKVLELSQKGQLIEKPQDIGQIFASRYMTILPSKEELKKIVEDKNYDRI